jgi:hypothetical protein
MRRRRRIETKIRTGKLHIILIPNAAIVPKIRKIKFDREYFIPHVGLLRINSALEKKYQLQY